MTLQTELCGSWSGPEKAGHNSRLVITVLSTTELETLAALGAAGALARGLDAEIRLVTVIVVPYPLDLTRPPVRSSFTIYRITSLVRRLNFETQLHICYCRDISAALRYCLGVKSLVVMGHKKKWWSLRENKLLRLVRSCGHQLVIAEVD